MSSTTLRVARRLGLAAGALGLLAGCGDAKPSASVASAADSVSATPEDTTPPQLFATPESASAALITAAEKFDVPALKAILGGGGADLVESEDTVQDRRTATELLALLAALRDDGRAICFVTHDRDFASALADRTIRFSPPAEARSQ